MLKDHFFIFMLIVLPISLFGQDNAEALKKVKDHYYSVNDILYQLERINLNGEVFVWMKDGVPQKISKYRAQANTVEFYFNENKELLFIFEQIDSVEYRYYFESVDIGLSENATFPALFRHIDDDQTFEAPFNQKRLQQILLKITEAAQAYLFVETSLALQKNEAIADPRDISKLEMQAVEINQKAVDTIAVIDHSESSDGEDEPTYYCVDKTIQLGYVSDSGGIRKEMHEEGCDGGHMVTQFNESIRYFDQAGQLFRKSEIKKIERFSGEALLYGKNSIRSKEETISYFRKDKKIETLKLLFINDVLVDIRRL
jgi:hypothetical protein